MIKFKDLVGVLHSSKLNQPCCKIRLLVEEYRNQAVYELDLSYETLDHFRRKFGDYTVFSITAVERDLMCIRIQYFKEHNEVENNDKEI